MPRRSYFKKHWLFLSVFYTCGLALLSWVFVLHGNLGNGADAWTFWLVKSIFLVVFYFKLLSFFDEGLFFWLLLHGGWLGLVWF
ncbi:MAG: hypothetical protein FJ267_08900 [Planctomycetes bacterium]|nr:hypothetical protein [Planctomycetota bacterium]